MIVPPLGEYWKARSFPIDNYHEMRRGATRYFDNAKYSIQGAWQSYKDRILPRCLPSVEDCGRGNPPRELVGDPPLLASVGSIEYAAMLSEFIEELPEHNANVFEIGGGYGGLAWSALTSGVSYWTIVDIPTTAACSQFYLEPWGVRKTILTPDQLKEHYVPYDCYVQTRGFMEMSPEEIQFYFDFIQKNAILGSLFFTINRFKKVSRLVEYPFDARWKIIKSDRWDGVFGMLLLERIREESLDLEKLLKDWATYE